MAGFTPLAEHLGEEATFNLVRQVTGEMAAAIEVEGGSIREFAGDSVMAMFGAPQALEDAPLKACRAALEIQRRMQSVRDQVQKDHGVGPAFRIGIHTGPVVLGSVGEGEALSFTALGDTVNVAARLQQAAEPDAVLISEATQALVGGYAECAPTGERTLKGKSEAQQVFRLEAIKSGITRFDISISRGLTPLVGRNEELTALDRHWQQARAGHLVVCDMIGDPGIGKSRLVHEFQRLNNDKDTTWLQGHCTPDSARTAYHPFVQVVRTSFNIGEKDDQAKATRRLQRGLDVIGVDSQEALPYLLNLLGYAVNISSFRRENAEVAGVRTRATLLEIIRARAQLTPTILFVDDCHWLDRASGDLLESALAQDSDLPLLLIRTYRNAPTLGRKAETDMCLAPLPSDEIIQVAAGCLNVEVLPAELEAVIVEKADGNPLFAEEIVAYLQRAGRLDVADGRAVYQAGDEATLPVNLQNLLMQRVDRLSAEAKSLIEAAAVAGRVFSPLEVAVASSLDQSLATLLDELVAQGLVRVTATTDDSPDTARFESALVRDGIYDSLLSDRRRDLHGRLGAAMEQLNSSHPDKVADDLARHFLAADDHANAVRYLTKAGEKNLRVYALEDAAEHFGQVIDLAVDDPACASDALVADAALSMARVLYYSCDFGGIIDLIKRVRPRFEALDDPSHTARMLFESGYAHVFSARQEEGKKLLERALQIGEQTGDKSTIGYACLGLGWYHAVYQPAGSEKTENLNATAERAIALGREIGDVWLTTKALLSLATVGIIHGRPNDARDHSLACVELSRTSGDPRPRSIGMASLALADAFVGEADMALESAEQTIEQSLCPIDRLMAQGGLFVARVMSAVATNAAIDHEAVLREGNALVEAFDEGQLYTPGNAPHSILGLAYILAGEFSEGIKVIQQAADRFDALGFPNARMAENYFLGLIYTQMALSKEKPTAGVIWRNLGFLITTLPRVTKLAEKNLQAALDQIKMQESPYYYADAAYHLGLLAQKRKMADQATGHFAVARESAEIAGAQNLIDLIDAAA